MARPAYERALDKVIHGENGCWLFVGARDTKGYGKVRVGSMSDGTRATASAHRVVYEEFAGPIPDGLVIDHLCRITNCVNPEHLEAVTPRENTLRGMGQHAVTARTGFCRKGHTMGDAYVYSTGHRACRACRAASRG